ncbi:threonine aldolase family protein [Butyrivibrio sp. FCS014]|uniref:threonine aldolase family protein n=1 Tax=Butyrivibrio sp. FCS014 TaxID=1408304 RepID=UPI0004B43D55|nr:beta-eliminating lyase-related protein [Butyrivibrio sp. FCS014]
MGQKISFSSDYTRNAHPAILKRLTDMGFEQNVGYGTDPICESAAGKIKKACDCPGAEVFFLVGGTQTNQTIIDMLLKPYEGVVAARTGHIAAHEAGAVEFSGHKVLTLPATGEETDTEKYGSNIGKISAKDLKAYLATFFGDDNHEHMVFPGAVYISHPTEYGTLYTKKELSDISEVCREYEIPLFLDGARLGYGLMSKRTDVTLSDIAQLTDVFYIGGTKVGAMFGEAVVFTKGGKPKHHVPIIKQHGALLAKGWLLGVQFDTLFTDDLYLNISKNAIDMAEDLKGRLKDKGYEFFLDSPTNQQFIIVDNDKLKELDENVVYSFWEKYDDNRTVIRLATDWATTRDELDTLMKYL